MNEQHFCVLICHPISLLFSRYIVPHHYRLLLHPNLTELSFKGSVQIQIDVQNSTNWVVLHSKNLKILQATVLDPNFSHLSDKVAVKLVHTFPICIVLHVNLSCSSSSRHYQFFITLPMNKLVFSLPECSQVVISTFSILSSGENFQKASVVSIRAPTGPAQERAGKPGFALNLCTHAREGEQLAHVTFQNLGFDPLWTYKCTDGIPLFWWAEL